MNTPEPAASPDRACLIAKGLVSFRATVAAMESALAVNVLMGAGYAVTFTEKLPGGSENVRVLARVNPQTRAYEANAAQCWPSLDVLPDHLCGICLYPRETAEKAIAKLIARGDFPGVAYRARHIREIQGERLERARAMVATLEAIQAKIPA